jgi:hypothetical protein
MQVSSCVGQLLRVPFLIDTRTQFRLTLPDFDPRPKRMNAEQLAKAKSLGFSDRQIAHLTGRTKDDVRARRKKLGLAPSDHLVGRRAAWFEACTRRTIRPATAPMAQSVPRTDASG